MSRYELQQLIQMWEQEKLTGEQMIGQILLHVQFLSGRLGAVEKQLDEQRRTRRRKAEGRAS